MNKKLVFAIGIVIIAVLAVVASQFDFSGLADEQSGNQNPELINNLEAQNQDVAEVITSPPAMAVDYRGESLEFLADPGVLNSYPQDFVEKQQGRLADTLGALKVYPKDVSFWIEIGLIKKLFNNYAGARDAWEYAKSIDSQNPVIYYNLGNLYGSYLNDFSRAEKNYLKAIELDPRSTYSYLGLAEFYRNLYREKFDRVDDVLLAGLEVLPSDPNLMLNLAFYYKESGEKANAVSYFEAFLKLPGIPGVQQQLIEEEIALLK